MCALNFDCFVGPFGMLLQIHYKHMVKLLLKNYVTSKVRRDGNVKSVAFQKMKF